MTTRQQHIEEYLALFAQLPAEEQRRHFHFALKWLVWQLRTVAANTVEHQEK